MDDIATPTPAQHPAVVAAVPVANPAARRRMVVTADGASSEAFLPKEWGLLLLIAAIWGSSFLFMEVGLRSFAPGVITLARVGLGAATLACFPAARRPIDREDWPRVVLLGVVWVAIPLTLFPIAQQWIDSSLAGMINAGVPLTSAVWATALQRRLPGRSQLVGLAIGFTGIVAISAPELGGGDSTALGAGLVILAIFLYGLSTNLTVPLQQQYGAVSLIFRVQLAALVLVAPYGLYGVTQSTFSWSAAAAMIPLGVLGTGLAFIAMATLVGRVGAPRGSIAIYFVPVVAILLGALLLDEAVTSIEIIGTGLVLLGAWATSRRESRRPSSPSASPAATD